jgi:CRP-like cAMP-binding protein
MEALESILSSLSLFEHLRADEIGRIAKRFELSALEAGESKSFAATMDAARLLVVVKGRVALEVKAGAGALRSTLEPGDRFGDTALLTALPRATTVIAEIPSEIATIDVAGLDALLEEIPAIALPLATELSSELSAKDDAVRQLLELHAENLPAEQLTAAIAERRAVISRHGARVARNSPRALFRRLVVQKGAEPPFWMLAGFIVSLSLARLTVAMILKYGLEKQLFALVPGNDPNPEHVHHFNYGLILIGSSGLGALFPFGRRILKGLAFAFGVGAGLVFDEFALFWNLNPEYAQSLSLIAAGVMAAVLVQLTYFRRFWTALLRRSWLKLRGAR